jgi:uncharacterized membrane protein
MLYLFGLRDNYSFKKRLNSFGEKPLCSLKQSRGILILDFCFPLCSRCTGLVVGAIIGYVASDFISLNIYLRALFMMLILVDVLRSKYFTTSNTNRFTTGMLFSIAII